jgi:O-antigen/teichoic acid export membrane protein
MKIKEKLISNATYLTLKWAFNTLFFLAFWIILGKVIFPDDPASYGVIALALQVATLMANLSLFGLDSTIAKLIPEMVERGEKKKINYLASFAIKATFVISIIASICLLIFNNAFPDIIKLNMDVMLLVVITTISVVQANILENVYYGLQNMKKAYLTNMYGWSAMIILMFVFTILGYGYIGPIAAVAVSFLVMIITRVKKDFFHLSNKIGVDKKTILKYSLPAFTVVILSSVLTNSQFIILSILKTFEDTGRFAAAMKIVSVISIIPTTFSGALFPITSGLSVTKNAKSKLSYLISLVFRYTLIIVVPISVFTIVFSKYLIIFFSSEAYVSATTFLPILVIGGVFLGIGQQFRQSLYAIGKPNKFRDSYIASTLVYLVLSIPLTSYYSSVGLAIAYLISSFILFLTTLIFIRGAIDFKMPIREVGKVIIAMSVSLVFLLLTKPYIPNIWISAPFVIVASLIYFLILLRLHFFVEEDLKFIDFLIAKIPIFKPQLKQLRDYFSRFVKTSYYKQNSN